MYRQVSTEQMRDFKESLIRDTFYRVGRRSVDGAQVDTLAFELFQDAVYRCYLFGRVIEPFDKEDFDEESSLVLL